MKDYRLKEVAQNVLRPHFEETTRSAYQEFMNDNNIPKTISDQAEKLAIIEDEFDIEQLKKERLTMAKTELRSLAMVTLYDLLEEKLEEIY